jgi:hypothetical protein
MTETPFDRLTRGKRIVEEDARGLPGTVLEAAGREALTEALGTTAPGGMTDVASVDEFCGPDSGPCDRLGTPARGVIGIGPID